MDIYVIHMYENGEGFDEPSNNYEFYEDLEDAKVRLKELYDEAVQDIKDNYGDEDDEITDEYIESITEYNELHWELNDDDHDYHYMSAEISDAPLKPKTIKKTTSQTTFWPGVESKEVK